MLWSNRHESIRFTKNNENRSLYDGLPPQGLFRGTAGEEFFIFMLWRKPCFRDQRQNIYWWRGQCMSPQTAPALCDNAVLPFQVSSHYGGCLGGGGERQ